MTELFLVYRETSMYFQYDAAINCTQKAAGMINILQELFQNNNLCRIMASVDCLVLHQKVVLLKKMVKLLTRESFDDHPQKGQIRLAYIAGFILH